MSNDRALGGERPGAPSPMGTRCSLFLVLLLALPLPARAQGLTPGDVDAARRHVAAQAAAGGARAADVADLAVTDAYRDQRSGLGLVYLQQRLDGVGVADGRVTVAVGRDGAVVHAAGAVVAGLAARAETRAPALSAADAAAWAARHVGLGAVAFRSAGAAAGPDHAETLDGGAALLQEPARARLAYHRADAADPAGALRLAWEVTLPLRTEPHWWVVAVDAVTGAELGRVDLVDHDVWGPAARADAREALGPWLFHEAPLVPAAATAAALAGTYGVYALPAESPNHATPAPPAEGRTLVADPADATASPYGWHDTDGVTGAEFTTTQGNNVHAYLDAVGDGLPDAGPPVDGGAGLVFAFPLSHTMGPGSYVPAAVTNLFYWNNVVHDVTYRYGFDSAAGNFQASTYGLGGLGGDDVLAEAQDGSAGPCEAAPFPCVNNANFATPADGARPRMQMYLWTHTTPLRDGDLDSGVIVHEYTHGISNRLTGGPAAAGCLENAEQMGEGWSDWYALMLTLEPGDLGPAARGIGTYVLGEPPTGDGIRAFPYSTSLAVDPRTYDAIETAGVPHGVGSVWAAMLWEVTWALIDAGGGTIGDVYDADGAAGNQVALNLVTMGMKLQPCFPGFVDGRDAILAADAALYDGAHLPVLWAAFAKRGLGHSAVQGSTGSVTDGAEAFDVPPPAGTAAVGPASVGVSLPVGGATTVPVTITHTDGGAPALDFTAALVAAPLAPRPAAPSGALTVLGREATRGDLSADGTGTASFGTGGPDAFGYTWADAYAPDGPAVAFADITATGTPVTSWTPTGEFPAPDEGYAIVPLPFPFPFYGVDRTAVRVFTNGFLTFSTFAADSYGNLPVPGPTAPNAVIAPLWDDLIIAAVMGASVHTGLLPDGRFVVQYTDAAQFAPSGSSLTFEVLLSPDGTIEYQYGPLTGGLFGASVGIEDDGGADGLAVVFDAPYLTSGHAVRFTPPPPWVHAAPGAGTIPAAGAGAVTLTFDAAGLAPGLYTADLVVTTNEIGSSPYTIPVSLQVGGLALADGAGWRMMALPVTGLGTDHLAAQNLVQGVPGYYPAAGANLFTGYDGTAWTPSTGTGEALPPGRALLWYLYDLDLDPGGPSVSHALPMTLTTPPGAVETAADVSVPLHTDSDDWNLIGNPFLAALDLTGLPGWATG
ncbi:MAG TPA: M36 family metallopeptidase, partial [Rhodothermales bacterium]|nr:M36 family metallopeptidase [Rhodothermales bacterium]